ncbi:AraC family transcriptional regulator [Fulvivirga sediminis]|uniref:Helix-turn-helix transcriptional regulator n=1 Tax=Fulvivirga sediminis TaxID=2803949 RepID=A0A937F8G6_9BACT|nr:AraC family transcriptional regulator [Fulvivirga sediminis]MBL3657650.1 helix-turn-helix transcriptional regulator [Fulvivirga sediminis]
MSKSTLYIKNMVCPRCISAVERVFNQLNLHTENIQLGQVDLDKELTDSIREELKTNLSQMGFELLESGKSSLISQIKSLIIDQIHHKEEALHENFSTYLSEQLHHEYSHLSRLFSSVEGITIEKFIAKQKIEKVKEYLFYDELSLSEIAYKMNYSSVAYLSTQFKKETGMTPTAFRQMHKPGHKSLDGI